MASTSKQPTPARTYLNLPPVMTLRGHKDSVRSISYFPDGKRMISGSRDKTARRWDLQAGREIEDMRNVLELEINSVAVSRDGRWVITGSGDEDHGELKACDVETGIVKIFEGHLEGIALACIDISEDGMLLASGSGDSTSRIWSLDTGELVAGPFESAQWLGAVRLSQDSKKLAVKSMFGKCLEVWDIQTQKLDERKWKSRSSSTIMTSAPVFWTNKGTILAPFTFSDSRPPKTIYEFDASTLETVGSAFEGHTEVINGLAFSSNGGQTILASASSDNTIKLWAFESRQLLASFRVVNPDILIFSPDTRQVAYTKKYPDHKIYICNTPPDILFSIGLAPDPLAAEIVPLQRPQRERARLPPRFFDDPETIYPPRQLNQPANASQLPARHSRIKGLVATLPFPKQSQQTQPEEARLRHSNGAKQFLQQHLSFRRSRPSDDPQVLEAEVAPGRKFTRLAVVNLPEYKKVGDTRRLPREQQQPGVSHDPSSESSDRDSLPDVHWCKALFCYCSCWSHGRLRVPPRWRLELVDETGQDCTTSGGGGANGRS